MRNVAPRGGKRFQRPSFFTQIRLSALTVWCGTYRQMGHCWNFQVRCTCPRHSGCALTVTPDSTSAPSFGVPNTKWGWSSANKSQTAARPSAGRSCSHHSGKCYDLNRHEASWPNCRRPYPRCSSSLRSWPCCHGLPRLAQAEDCCGWVGCEA